MHLKATVVLLYESMSLRYNDNVAFPLDVANRFLLAVRFSSLYQASIMISHSIRPFLRAIHWANCA
jgi:hypothetical protein